MEVKYFIGYSLILYKGKAYKVESLGIRYALNFGKKNELVFDTLEGVKIYLRNTK